MADLVHFCKSKWRIVWVRRGTSSSSHVSCLFLYQFLSPPAPLSHMQCCPLTSWTSPRWVVRVKANVRIIWPRLNPVKFLTCNWFCVWIGAGHRLEKSKQESGCVDVLTMQLENQSTVCPYMYPITLYTSIVIILSSKAQCFVVTC